MQLLKNKKTLTVSLFLASLMLTFLLANFSFAQKALEVQYPPVPLPDVRVPVSTRTPLPDYIKYIFTFALMIAGLIAFGSIIFGGVRYATSVGNPTVMSDAQGQILAGVLGLFILLGSYLILTTINPQLVVLGTVKPWLAKGVELKNTNTTQVLRVGVSQADLGDLNPDQINFLPSSPPSLLKVFVYPEISYRGGGKEVPGTGALPLVPKSIVLSWQLPGVYLYGTEQKEEFWTSISVPSFDKEFNDKATKIKLKQEYQEVSGDDVEQKCKDVGGIWENGKCYTAKFGAILHENSGYQGQCRIFQEDKSFLKNEEKKDAYGTIDKASAVTVFMKSTPTPGAFVKLCRQPDLNDCKELRAPIAEPTYIENIEEFGAGWNDKVQSIQIEGNYLVVLMNNKHEGGGKWDDNTTGKCQVFNKQGDPDLKDDPIGRCKVTCSGIPVNPDSPGGVLCFWRTVEPCASSIAIYPVK